MSFVDMELKVEFNGLLTDYHSAVGACQNASLNARRVFERDPIAAVGMQQSVDQASFSLYIARKNLFDFFLAHLDHFTFDTDDFDSEVGG